MHHSGTVTPLLPWLLVALCAVSGGYCLLRVRGSAGRADAVMGLGMAVMALPLAGGGHRLAPVLGVVFAAASLHAVWLLRDGPGHAHHLVGSLAMVYMALWTGVPWLTGALLLYYAGYVLRGGARLAEGPAALTRACRLAMGLGMFSMLLL
ncbi:DUF5134 domain-containing protein [Streptomyces sp. NPDC012888]|uniref:DUF5134 domain-containing protein n=1 Tax=Streptomyces sp. NPDC012888 TaxID=3364855 RepID=UPI00369BAF07